MLPSLVTLDISNNKLHTLPYNMWKSPKLKELNAAFNLLRELPTNPSGVSLMTKLVHRKKYR
jgi:Leucine-rich repeat (LRR) protein